MKTCAESPLSHRVELDPLSLLGYTLDREVYREAGPFTDEVVVDAPFRLLSG